MEQIKLDSLKWRRQWAEKSSRMFVRAKAMNQA